MYDQASQNNGYLQQNIKSEQLNNVPTFAQNLKITGILHHEWKRMNLLGDFEFFMEFFKSPIYKRKTKTTFGHDVFLYRKNEQWRIGPNYDGAQSCWAFIKSNALDPVNIQEDKKRTKEVWHEHKSGSWLPVKNFKIRDLNNPKKSKPKNNRRSDGFSDGSSDNVFSEGSSDMSSNHLSDSCSEEDIKYATPRCLRTVRR